MLAFTNYNNYQVDPKLQLGYELATSTRCFEAIIINMPKNQFI